MDVKEIFLYHIKYSISIGVEVGGGGELAVLHGDI
jgi:hypothetical protein